MLLVSCTSVSKTIPDKTDQFCLNVDLDLEAMVRRINLRVVGKVLDEKNFNYFAEYHPKDKVVYFSQFDEIYEVGVCTHEYWHALMHQHGWSYPDYDELKQVLYNYLSKNVSKFNDIQFFYQDMLVFLTEMSTEILNLQEADGAVNLHKYLTQFVKDVAALGIEYQEVLDDPLSFNFRLDVRNKLNEFIDKLRDKHVVLQAYLRDMNSFNCETYFLQIENRISIIDDFQANYFSELAVEELLVQMLTVLTGNFLKVDDDIQVLNEDMLMVLSRLKINNIDLGPFIQRYKVRHNLLD